ncbi:hypothetical protein BJ742DRAFT_842137 [Cladochytrium replicatum]|nr:hypothetical protein BJ742DRAFT_842137 [Cladochytrium replicatum]
MRQAVTIAFAPVFILLIVACVFFADQVYTSTNGAPFIIIGIVSAVAGIFLLFYAKKSTDEALRRSEEIVRGFALEDAGLGVNWVFVKERIGQDSDDFRYWIEVRVSNDRPDVRQTRAFSRMEVDSPLHPKIVVTIE